MVIELTEVILIPSESAKGANNKTENRVETAVKVIGGVFSFLPIMD